MKHAATPALLLGLCAVAPLAAAGTTTTTYSYNTDGALTAMTVQTDGGVPTTTYLTWDNFTPDAAKPATGTLQAGNGRLVSVGAAPGGPAQFGFDARDRLLGQGTGATTQAYGYHANSQLASAALGGSTRAFYQGSGKYPQVLNIAETDVAATRWSTRLGAGRYLSDGTEQVLIHPRKDTAGLLDPVSGSLAGYAYDPFGAQPDGEQATGYDLADNPFQYAGEYRDPAWGGVYLRARWYAPDLAQFISRDPMPHLNRYGYAGGNPVTHIDPGGMNFFHSLYHDMNKGWWGHLDRVFLAPLMGPLAIAADPKGFWEQVKHDKGGIDIFLAVGVATEFASMGLEGAGWSETIRTIGAGKRIWGRRLFDAGLGLAQAVTAGATRGKHFDLSGFTSTLEMSYGALGWSHYAAGIGYHPYAMKGSDLIDAMNRLNRENDNGALVFRERSPLGSGSRSLSGGAGRTAYTSPLAEQFDIGLYHDAVMVVTRDAVYRNELTVMRVSDGRQFAALDSKQLSERQVAALQQGFGKGVRYQEVGRLDDTFLLQRRVLNANPRGLFVQGGSDPPTYSLLRNNCHMHARAVLQGLDPR